MERNLKVFKNKRPQIDTLDDIHEFSVFVPIININNTDMILFEVRSDKLVKQPSEICFPGGRIEPEETARQAAIRETSEELFIEKAAIKVIGELDTIVTPFNAIIYPFIGYINSYSDTFSMDEVKEVFHVPLDFFIETPPLSHKISINIEPSDDFPYHMIQKGKNYPWARGAYPVFFYQYKDKIIWGITARIIYSMIKAMKSL